MTTFKVFSSREHVQREVPFTLKPNAIEAIYRFGEFRFTATGRKYSMITRGGAALGHLMNASDSADFKEYPEICEQLDEIKGAIAICNEADGSDGEFLPYRNLNELVNSWYELAKIAGIQIGEADQDALEIYLTDEEGEED